jgi:CheY-like chemotaxis protein
VIYTTHPMLRDGQIIGAVISFMDVTDRRAMEQAREQAREAAERLARVKSEFLANMSHEIRTPLNGVLGLARIGYRDNAGRKAQNLFARILDSGGLLLGIVNDILDFSKIEAGKLHLEAIPVDLPRLLRNTADALRERSDGKDLKLSVVLAPDLPSVCCTDPLRLRQILTNLLSNAIKFTGQGEVKLFAGLENDSLLLRVSDTGIGMDEQQLARLFIAFEQADTSTTRRFGGTGLGLAITKRLTELFGGTIRADSQPGRGSHFEVRIPYASGDLPFMHDQASSPHALPDRQRLAGISVLVAEDNEVNQMVLEDLLLSEGARIEMVHNGRAAVERVAEAGNDAFQLVLMDIQMPEMDGYEATRRIRAKAPHLPIIGQTAHAMAEEKAKCLEAGMVDHIAKPIDLDVLVATILRHVQRLPDSAASRQEASTPLLHWTDLEARYAGKPEFIRKLLGVFINSQTPVIEEIRTTAANGNTEKLVRLAHSLKGSAGNIMASSLMGLALETEHAARDNRPEAMALACDLADRLDATLAEITDRLKG